MFDFFIIPIKSDDSKLIIDLVLASDNQSLVRDRMSEDDIGKSQKFDMKKLSFVSVSR